MSKRIAARVLPPLAAAAVAAVVYASLGAAAVQATPTSSTAPSISGTTVVGSVLTANGGSWTGSPTSYGFQWMRCDASGGGCGAIAGATGQTYTLQSADAAHTLRVNVTATNADGTGGPVLSGQTAEVTAATAPANTAAPALTGTLQQGQALSVANGTWSGTAPITYSYEWQRCNAQGVNCAPIAGAGSTTTYTLAAADVGSRIQVLVTAKNSAGESSKYSNQSGQVGASGTAPANTAAPALSGTYTVGQTLNVGSGTWSGTTPMTFSYQWQRCNAQGVGCTPIAGVTGQAYTLTAADAGNRVQVLVTATNSGGSGSKYSNQSPAIASSGGTTASAGSVAAASVALPDRLVIDKVQYPQGAHPRAPFEARFHVSDTAKHSVSGALVYLVGLPYGWVRTVPEQSTDATGWVTLTLNPTAKMPLRTALVMFVRARTPQGDPLAGASTRRLVQVRIRG